MPLSESLSESLPEECLFVVPFLFIFEAGPALGVFFWLDIESFFDNFDFGPGRRALFDLSGEGSYEKKPRFFRIS